MGRGNPCRGFGRRSPWGRRVRDTRGGDLEGYIGHSLPGRMGDESRGTCVLRVFVGVRDREEPFPGSLHIVV